jgi:hypothetical protein
MLSDVRLIITPHQLFVFELIKANDTKKKLQYIKEYIYIFEK